MNNKFKKLNVFRRLSMPLDELEAYYREKREHDKDKEIKYVGLRKFYSNIFRFILCLNRHAEKRKYVIVGDKRRKSDKAHIYANTHYGEIDGLVAYEALKDHCYWFWGDVGEYYKKIDYPIVCMNGTVVVDTWDKTDRHNARNTAIKVLKKKANLMFFPEGTWNITEAKPVMYLFPGAADMAIESGAEIIPVGIELYGDTYYINIGENISSEGYTQETKYELTAVIRDAMATLKWEIWEQYGKMKRADLPENASELWQNKYEQLCIKMLFPMEKLRKSMYIDKKDVEMWEVQSIRDNLIPSRAKAFLFSKRNHG